jgi:4-hydroxybenzoate polyprenyltransferase
VMRGAGCAFNDIVDRKFDVQVARTRGRPIPSGRVSVFAAAVFTVILAVIGLAILVQFNRFTVILGAASLILVAAYPFMKRITWWPQAWLGLTFNWGALMGFAAQTGHLDLPDMLLYAGLFFWTLGYDTIYAHQDKEDDALIGVKSTARLLMNQSGTWILRFYAACFTLVLAAGFAEHAGWPFAPVMLAAGAHLLWQVRHLDINDAALCLKLFRANATTGALFAASFALAAWLG